MDPIEIELTTDYSIVNIGMQLLQVVGHLYETRPHQPY